jgi:ribosomal protein L40E
VFFVLTTSQLSVFRKDCEYKGGLVSANGASYQLDFIPQDDGDYYFVFVNDSPNTAHFSFDLSSVATAAVTSTLFSTIAQAAVIPWTQTISTAYTQGVAESPLGSGSLLLIVVVIVVVALGAFFLLRTRPKQKGVGAKVYLCANCGAQLAHDAKFCKKCGKPTS